MLLSVYMTENRFYYTFLIFLVLSLGYLTYQIISPFISPIMWAIVLSIVFYPVYAFVLKYVKLRSVASVMTLVIIFVILFGPVAYFSYLLSLEAMALVNRFQGGEVDLLDSIIKHPMVNNVINKILALFHMTEEEFHRSIVEGITKLARESTGILREGFGNIIVGGLNFVLMLLSIFFFLHDGPFFIEKIGSFIPFSQKQREKLLGQTKDIVVSTIYGGVAIAMGQGIIGGVAFALLGIPSPVVWGLAMFVASLVPLVGTFIIWGPAVVYLFFQAQYLKGVILFLVGMFAISSIDNILRPLIIRGKVKMPMLAIFFGILGGIKLFGLIGFIMGPLILALFVSVFEIFRYSEEERAKVLDKK